MNDEIPQWARERACELANNAGLTVPAFTNWQPSELALRDDRNGAAMSAFARYIAAHEEPPVDPLIAERNRIVDRHHYTMDGLRNAVMDALRRGMELAKGGSA